MNMKNNTGYGHRAWLVFLGVCVYYFVAFGLLFSGFGLFLTDMSQQLGIGYTQLSATSTIRVLSGMITTAMVGNIFPKVNLRHFLTGVLLVVSATLIALTFCRSLWQFYLIFAIMGLACGLSLYGIVPMILNRWFERPAGLITIANVVGGAGGVILCPILSQIIQSHGWQAGYRFMAAMVLCLMVPVTFFLLDLSPVPLGLSPCANNGKGKKAPAQSVLAQAGKKVPPFVYGMLALFFLISALMGGMYIHLSSAMFDKGFTAVQVGLLLSMFQAGTSGMQLLDGMASTRFGLRPVTNIFLVIVASTALAMMFLQRGSSMIIACFVVFLMGGSRAFGTINSLITRYVCGQEAFNRAYPKLHACYLACTALTAVIYSGIFTATGSYNGTYLLMLACAAALIILTNIIFVLVDNTGNRN